MEFLVKLLLNSIAVIVTAYLLPGVQVESIVYGFILAAVLALLNVSVKPLLVLFTLPASILTLGLFLLVINACIILIAEWLMAPHFTVRSFWWALLFSVVLSLVNSIFERLAIKKDHREDAVKIYDKDGNRVV